MNGAAPPLAGYQQRALTSVLCFWLVVSFMALVNALLSDWPASAELPTAVQVRQARANVGSAGVVSVVPALGGLLLARRWRSAGWTAAFLVGLVLAVLVSGVLWVLTDSPVRPG